MRDRRRATLACVLAAMILLGASGCVTSEGGALGEIGRSSADASSDVKSAALALRLYRDGKSTDAVADTALSDALTNLTGTQSSVASLSVATRAERRARNGAEARIHEAVAAVNEARNVLEKVPGAVKLQRAISDLHESSSRLSGLAKDLGQLP